MKKQKKSQATLSDGRAVRYTNGPRGANPLHQKMMQKKRPATTCASVTAAQREEKT